MLLKTFRDKESEREENKVKMNKKPTGNNLFQSAGKYQKNAKNISSNASRKFTNTLYLLFQ